jgi:hypothetical protein
MRSRKEFLVTAGATALLGATASPKPSPTPTPPPSSAAHEVALRMRKFDSALTDAQIDAIATGIDQGFAAGKTIRAHHALSSGDGPSPEFAVDE